MRNVEDKLDKLEDRISNIEQLLIKNTSNNEDQNTNNSESAKDELVELKSIFKNMVEMYFASMGNDNLVDKINDGCTSSSGARDKWTKDDIGYSPRTHCWTSYKNWGLCDSCARYSKLLQFISE